MDVLDEKRFTKSRTVTKRMVHNLLHQISFTAHVTNNKERDSPLKAPAVSGNDTSLGGSRKQKYADDSIPHTIE